MIVDKTSEEPHSHTCRSSPCKQRLKLAATNLHMVQTSIIIMVIIYVAHSECYPVQFVLHNALIAIAEVIIFDLED